MEIYNKKKGILLKFYNNNKILEFQDIEHSKNSRRELWWPQIFSEEELTLKESI
jgi:hypothetical protein